MIQLKNIHKTFGDHIILKGVSLSVTHGEVVAIIGPSGSGKSTLLRCINYLETPDRGSVYIDGVAVHKGNIEAIRHKVGMVFQHFNLFENKTVLENLTYAPIKALKTNPKVAQARALALLSRVGLEDKVNAYPNTLSGGQKQRVAIARTLAMEPTVLLCDEPTSALDPEMVKEVLTVIQSLAQEHKITILMNTHEMAFAQKVADRIIFLDRGSILESAPPATFFGEAKHPRVRAFLEKVL